MLLAQTLFGAIFVSIGQNVLDGELAERLKGIIPTITPQQIESSGATGLLNIIPAQYWPAASEAYNESLRVCFRVALIAACLSILGGMAVEWRSVKKEEKAPPKTAESEHPMVEVKRRSGETTDNEGNMGGNTANLETTSG
jgi:hypothetical protein